MVGFHREIVVAERPPLAFVSISPRSTVPARAVNVGGSRPAANATTRTEAGGPIWTCPLSRISSLRPKRHSDLVV